MFENLKYSAKPFMFLKIFKYNFYGVNFYPL